MLPIPFLDRLGPEPRRSGDRSVTDHDVNQTERCFGEGNDRPARVDVGEVGVHDEPTRRERLDRGGGGGVVTVDDGDPSALCRQPEGDRPSVSDRHRFPGCGRAIGAAPEHDRNAAGQTPFAVGGHGQ